jgi:PAS domain S-box-containing protein
MGNQTDETALRRILEGTATEIGERFFASLVKNLAEALDTYGAWVTEYIEASQSLRAHAFWAGNGWVPNYDQPVVGTPCEVVIREARLVHFPDNVVDLFPRAERARSLGAVSYMGVPLKDLNGRILGHLAVIDNKPMPVESRKVALIQIFGARAAAELQRLRAEQEVRQREEQFVRLFASALDGIVKLDKNLRVVMMNPAAENLFQCRGGDLSGQPFVRFLAGEGAAKLESLVEDLDSRAEGKQSLWIPGGLKAAGRSGEEVHTEATLSRFESGQERFYTLILRNINERLEAERRISFLTREAEVLKEEIRNLLNADEIIGQSEPMRQMLGEVRQVAETDSTVLIVGETGTGKELVARALHASGARRDRPLIRVNCAAIPASLIESEFFGHEKGAFTGATARREGRFSLADGGTIFLDEIGELPFDLQGKLLRVLQEGEFEPVGSSRTKKVNVRVLAATNRDLHREVKEGRFREDLYYRLNVFPIEVPPLRVRGDDVVLLATHFTERFAKRIGKPMEHLPPEWVPRLKSYPWPGNVRELANVIERAVITSQNGRLNLARALPLNDGKGRIEPEEGPPADRMDIGSARIRTLPEIRELERRNLLQALEESDWQVAGEGGAARRLGMNPSTLSSRIKALGIRRPSRT